MVWDNRVVFRLVFCKPLCVWILSRSPSDTPRLAETPRSPSPILPWIFEAWPSGISIYHSGNHPSIVAFSSSLHDGSMMCVHRFDSEEAQNYKCWQWVSFPVISPSPSKTSVHENFHSTATLASSAIIHSIIERFQKLNWKHFLSGFIACICIFFKKVYESSMTRR